MSIGCYDGDLAKYDYSPYNLELMKISAYYKKRGEIVGLASLLLPNRYSKFFYRQDFSDGNFPRTIFKSDNVEWGGHAFSGTQYIPLPEEIERQRPDITLYEGSREKVQKRYQYFDIFERMRKARHLRISLDGKTIWKDFTCQLFSGRPTSFFIHDYNLQNIKGSFELLSDLSNEEKIAGSPIPIGMKFPVQVDNRKDLFKWGALRPMQRLFLLQYNGIMDDQLLSDFIEYEKGSSIRNEVDYLVTAGRREKEFIESGTIRQLFLQCCFLRMNNIRMILKYDENFFSEPMWNETINLFNTYLRRISYIYKGDREKETSYDTLFNYCRNLGQFSSTITVDKARDIFRFIADRDPKLFQLFYECHTVKLENGRLTPND